MLPVLEGVIARRILLNFCADPEVVQDLVPAPLEVERVRDSAIVGVCLIRLEHLRPKGIPSVLGMSSENMAHRVAIRFPFGGEMKPGVFIWRRETDQRMVQLLGGRLFPGVHGRATFDVTGEPNVLKMNVSTTNGEADVRFSAWRTSDWPGRSIFADLDEISEFFRKGDCGFSCTLHGAQVEGLQLRTLRWEVEPLEIEHQHCAFYLDSKRFPAGSVMFDSALLMRGLPHEWHEIKHIPELADSPVPV
jgi:Uncharacterized conserved protein (COG2071)